MTTKKKHSQQAKQQTEKTEKQKKTVFLDVKIVRDSNFKNGDGFAVLRDGEIEAVFRSQEMAWGFANHFDGISASRLSLWLLDGEEFRITRCLEALDASREVVIEQLKKEVEQLKTEHLSKESSDSKA